MMGDGYWVRMVVLVIDVDVDERGRKVESIPSSTRPSSGTVLHLSARGKVKLWKAWSHPFIHVAACIEDICLHTVNSTA